MVMRLIRWAYELGVQHERRRIAAYLQSAQSNRYDSIQEIERQLAPHNWNITDKELAKEESMRLQHKIAVDRDVIDIIAGLFQSEEKYQRGVSIMFPGGEEKL